VPLNETDFILDSAEPVEHDGPVSTGYIIDRSLEGGRTQRDGYYGCGVIDAFCSGQDRGSDAIPVRVLIGGRTESESKKSREEDGVSDRIRHRLRQTGQSRSRSASARRVPRTDQPGECVTESSHYEDL
jgi:hypothetical protein